MIGYLQGILLDQSDGKLLIGVGGGKSMGRVGYLVFVAQSDYELGQEIELFIYSHVREEALDLYGFKKLNEKSLFLTLLEVNGIGPKSALTILGSVDPFDLVSAIVEGNKDFLTRIPGIGKKTAERCVVELKDSLKKKMDSGYFDFPFPVKNATHSEGEKSNQDTIDLKGSARFKEGLYQDAKGVLLSLGYKELEVNERLKSVFNQIDFNMEPSVNFSKSEQLEQVIRLALKHLNSGMRKSNRPSVLSQSSN